MIAFSELLLIVRTLVMLVNRITLLVGALAFIAGSYCQTGLSQLNTLDLERLGLELKWAGNAENLSRSKEPLKVVLWPHGTAKTEYVDVKIGNRVVQRIQADLVDEDALKLALEQNTLRVGSPEFEAKARELTDNPPRIGLEGAKKRAEKAIQTYALLGKQATMGDAVSVPNNYLVTASQSGSIEVFDAENGTRLWSSVIGNQTRVTRGPGVSDKYVAAINGYELYLFDLMTGRLINSRRLLETPGAGPLPMNDRILVPTLLGGVLGYHATDVLLKPWVYRLAGNSVHTPVPSADRRFFAWTVEPNYVNIGISGKKTDVWNRMESAGRISNQVVAVENGFIASTDEGGLYHISLDRNVGFEWKFFSGSPAITAPAAGSGLVFSVTNLGAIYAVDDKTGDLKWSNKHLNLEQVVAVTKERLYVRSQGNLLVVLDLADGRVLGTSQYPISHAFTNTINDRLYLFDRGGRIYCLREASPDYVLPRMHYSITPKEPVESEKPVENGLNGTQPTPFSNPFKPPATEPATNPFGTSASPFGTPGSANSTENSPFGSPPKSTPSNNPFE